MRRPWLLRACQRARSNLGGEPVAALGLALATRGTALGLAIGGAALAFAGGFADAKLRTEMTRAPVLAKELHNVTVKGFVEAFERREKRRVRITLRVISLGALAPEATPYRVRVSLSEKAGPETPWR